jgi:glucosamine--fructose-6-phosphate aminotransferase (isomerizing)
MTNETVSPLAETADGMLSIDSGLERAVAGTKTYVNSLGAVALLFTAIGSDANARRQLARIPRVLQKQIELLLGAAQAFDPYRDALGARVVARGINYGTALEIALKIRELSGLLVEAYSAADLVHGPIAAIAPGWPEIVVGPSGLAQASLEEICALLRDRGARLVVIFDDSGFLAFGETALRLGPSMPGWLSPFIAVVPKSLPCGSPGHAISTSTSRMACGRSR